jgi:hypothetical protein
VAVLVENTAKAIMVAERAMEIARVVREDLLPALVAITVYMASVLNNGGTPTGENHSAVFIRQA